MSRKRRLWYPGAIYHITCRGNHKQLIFNDDEDRRMYINILRITKANYQFNLLSYCLMNNHVHLQIETIQIHISVILKQINMIYVLYFNKKYQVVGHLFQGRFKSELIDSDAYNLEVSRYIHLNPVRAQMVDYPEKFLWSSYLNYLGVRQDKLVSTESILRYYNNCNPILYQSYVEKSLLGTDPILF